MTTIYDPFHPRYLDETDLRQELTRVYDLCHGCRLCFKFCTAFPTLFDLIDQFEDQDAARLTPAEQDRVVDQCFNCKLCYVNCPYTPDQHEWNLDFPRLMLRAEQVSHQVSPPSVKERIQIKALTSTDLVGKVGTTMAPLANKAIGTPGSRSRQLMEKATGIASQRLLPPYTKQRFSSWFRKRTTHQAPTVAGPQGDVAIFATCLVEYQDPGIGHDLVKVYERNGVTCSLPDGQVCCGAPALHSGDIDGFVKQGRKNIKVLAAAIRDGKDVVCPQPTCSYVLKYDYQDYIGGPDADLVAEHTFDAAEYLWTQIHKAEDKVLDQVFDGDVPATITYHAPCHLRAQNIGLKSRDLLKRTGAKVTVVAECSAIDGTWGYKEQNYERSRKVAKKMADAIERADGDVIAGDCHLANGGIRQETGRQPQHPLQVIARAYGIPEEDR